MLTKDATPYSHSQMADYYSDLSRGILKTSGVMNYIQHVIAAKYSSTAASVLDLCCGRGLLIPVLATESRFSGHLCCADYSIKNMLEARTTTLENARGILPFKVTWICCDATRARYAIRSQFDVICYLSSLEHMDRRSGIASLETAKELLAANGTLLLSTPNTEGQNVQYRVHVYEWSSEDLEEILLGMGFRIIKKLGLLTKDDQTDFERVVLDRFGPGALAWLRIIKQSIPEQFVDTVFAAALPDLAKEVLYVCTK